MRQHLHIEISNLLKQVNFATKFNEVTYVMNALIRNNGFRNFSDSLISSVMPNWDEFLPTAYQGPSLNSTSRLLAVDIKETDTEYQVIADLPGTPKDNIEVSVKDDVLSLTVRSEDEKSEESQGRIIRQERYQGTFKRSFKLNDLVDDENIQATYKDGVLSISVPKKEPVQPRKIEVAVH